MTWTNPTTNLWYTTSPTPGVITFDGTYYRLQMSSVGASFKYEVNNLPDAQNQYTLQATSLLAKTVSLQPQLISLAVPNDQELVAIYTGGGMYAIGIWSSSGQYVTVSAQVIPASSIQTWTPLD